jgi:hypothetical protein
MLENLPSFIALVFLLTVVASIYFFYKATNFYKPFLNIIIIWFSLQALLGINYFYTVNNSFPPRFIALIIPPILGIVLLFSLPKGRLFLDRLNTKYLTLLHVVRVPVEMVLYWLYLHKTIPQLMTFEGQNFDILVGISAPIVLSLSFRYQKVKRNLLLVWNIIGLALLANIVTLAILSAPFPFQQLAFEQPNIAVLYFPFNCLPAIVVPLVLLSHLASIRSLLKK